MKRILLSLLSFVLFLHVGAQNLTKLKEAITAKKYAEANTIIETLLAAPKNQKNTEIYYLKAKLLSAISMDKDAKATMPEARMQSLEALKKSLSVDSNQTSLFLTVDNYQPLYDLYAGGFEEGAEQYNDQNYEKAMTTFKTTGVIGDFIFEKGWGLYKLDTTLTYYMGLAAYNAKKEAEAMGYFKKLADAEVGGTEDMSTPYRFLSKYYYDKKDEENFNKYVNLGLKIFPKDDYLPLLALDQVRDKNDQGLIMKKYEELLAINPESFDINFEYASELFGETHVSESSKRPADYNERCVKIESIYEKCLNINPQSYETMLSLGKHYYNQMLFLEEDIYKIRGTKPEDVQKKAELNKKLDELGTKAIPQLEKVFNQYDGMGKLKVGERSSLKSACTLLNYCYEKKNDKTKAAFYQKKYDEADTAHQ
jgi:hypothetical protein